MPQQRRVTVLTCHDPVQAEFLKSFLNSHGLQADLSNNRPGWTGRYGTMARGVRLQVPAQEAAEAKTLIAEAESGVFALSEEEEMLEEEDLEGAAAEAALGPYRPTACPGCGSPEVYEAQRGGWFYKLFNLLFLGLPWLLAPRIWACQHCGWQWTERDIAEELESQDRPPE